MSMMEKLTFFLGLQIKQTKEGIFINQTKYVREIPKKFGMENIKKIGTSMSPTCRHDKDKSSKSMDQNLYKCIISFLLYLTTSRPDILFSIYMCARFQSNSKESHLPTVKQIFRFLIYIHNLGLWYTTILH